MCSENDVIFSFQRRNVLISQSVNGIIAFFFNCDFCRILKKHAVCQLLQFGGSWSIEVVRWSR